MEDDEGMMGAAPQGVPAPMLHPLALTATGDFFLLVGMFFILLGAANFITDFLKIKGIGEVAVGLALVGLAAALLLRSRSAMRRMQMSRPQPQPREKVRSEDYR